MGRKRKKESRAGGKQVTSRIPLIILVISIYYMMVLFYVLCLISFDPILIDSLRSPTPPLIILLGLYYILPVILAVLFGGLFRPFWRNLRNILFPIFYIALLYSFGVFMLRSRYVEPRWRDIRQAMLAHFQVETGGHTKLDENGDGLPEIIEINCHFRLNDFPPGQYQVSAYVESSGPEAIYRQIGQFTVLLIDEKSKAGLGHFTFECPPGSAHDGRKEYDLHIQLHRLMDLSDQERQVLALARWAPFFRTTFWDGCDSELNAEPVLLDTASQVDSFVLPGAE